MNRTLRFFLIGIVLLASIPAAQAQIYRVVLSGANEIPVVNTPGTGFAIVSLNPTTHEMRVRVVFSGLIGTTTASHLHCCAPQPANVGVATTTPTFPGTPLGVTSGAWDRTYDMSQPGAWNPAFITANGGTTAGAEAALLAGVASGQIYFNLHSSVFGGGELRGFLVLNRFQDNAGMGAQGAAVALDALGAGTGILSDTLVTLALLSPAEQAAALGKLSPNASRGTQVAVSENISTAFDQLSNRMDGLRLADRDGGSIIPDGLGSLPTQKNNGFWFAGNGVQSRQKARSEFAGYRNEGWGLTAGFDRRLASSTLLGGSVNYADSELTFRNHLAGDQARIEHTQLSIYLNQSLGRAFIDAMAGYGWQDYDTTRDTGVAGLATGDSAGHSWGLRIGGGVPVGLGSRASITPQARLDWDKVKQYGYRENGGGPLGLSVDARSADGFRSTLGLQLDFASRVGDIKARPFVRGFWQHNFDDEGLDSSATFVAGGPSFNTRGQLRDRNPYIFGAGINFFGEGAFTGAIVYDGHLGASYQSHVYQAKLRWTF
jgi:outer membrane autotransporter protein